MSPRHPEDVHRIQQVALAHGVALTEADAEDAWDSYSDSMAAGWMALHPDDGDLWATVRYHLGEAHLPAEGLEGMDGPVRYPDDVLRIRQVALAQGMALTAVGAQRAWEAFSDTMAAGWLLLPSDDGALWADVSPHLPA